jgi:plasmid stability protein
MTMQPVTLHLPSPLYKRLKRRAERSHRTLEAELLEVVATAVPVVDELPADLEDAISPLSLLDDEALWRAAGSHFSAESAAQLEGLHLKRQRDGLTEAEAQALAGLMRQYERTLLVRAQAAALLKQRGHDVSGLIPDPSNQ